MWCVGHPPGVFAAARSARTLEGRATNLLCRLGRHKWKRMVNDEGGGHYLQCQRCGKDRNVSGGPGDWAAPLGY